MKRVSVAFRMTIGLVLMTISSILFANLAGIMQNPNEIHTSRKVGLCETLAINCSLLAQKNDAQSIAANIQLVCQRNPEILSIGLRREDGKLAYQVGDHIKHWHVDSTASDKTTAQSTKDNILVPITHRGRAWGTLEVAFGAPDSTAWSRHALALQYPILSLVAFCGLMNAGSIYFYLRRTLTYLDPAKAVPNRVRSALDTLAEGLVVLDSEQRIVLANQAFAKTLGQEPDQLQGVHVDKLAWQQQEDSSPIPPWEVTADNETNIGQTIGLKTESEGERIFRVNAAPILDEQGDQRGVLASFDDITILEENKAELHTMLSELSESREQIKKRNQELQILATRDALTGCMNRRTFFESFEKLWKGSKRHNQPLSCVMLDIDFFKSINDNYGHSMGDEVLRKVAHGMQGTCREEDVLCRYGGEEFCLLMPHLTIDQAELAAERFRCVVQELTFSDPELRVTISLGVSSVAQGGADPQEMLDQADKSLYTAKRTGRNRVCRWDNLSDDDIACEEEVSRDPNAGSNAVREIDDAIPYPAVASLLAALNFRDPATAAHCTRVAEYAVATARGLMSVRDAYILEVAALLHDIGKIGVPDRILMKSGPLTEEEWRIMRIHDRIGVEIVESSFANQQLVDIVRFHHATYDGQGEGDNTTGEEIPLGARLVTIADAYDAMVSDRIYRKGRSQEEAFDELRRCAGTQFDPRLVERFIAIVEDYHVKHTIQVDSKQAALELGLQIEQLAVAMDGQDIVSIQSLAGTIQVTAAKHGVSEVESLASELSQLATSDPDLHQLVNLTRELLDLCRVAQLAHIEETPETVAVDTDRRATHSTD